MPTGSLHDVYTHGVLIYSPVWIASPDHESQAAIYCGIVRPPGLYPCSTRELIAGTFVC